MYNFNNQLSFARKLCRSKINENICLRLNQYDSPSVLYKSNMNPILTQVYINGLYCTCILLAFHKCSFKNRGTSLLFQTLELVAILMI
jgi:hypothetical protein